MTPTSPHGIPGTERRAADRAEAEYVNELLDREQDEELITLETGPHSLLILICGLRLAAAHPGMPEFERSVLVTYADHWAKLYAGTPAEAMAADGVMPIMVDPQIGLN